MDNKIPYQELMIALLVIIMFVVSVSIGMLSSNMDNVKSRIDSLESKTLTDK
jgi:hypothetical protein